METTNEQQVAAQEAKIKTLWMLAEDKNGDTPHNFATSELCKTIRHEERALEQMKDRKAASK